MALPSGLELAVIILSSMLLLVLSVVLFAYVVRLGETDGDEKWRTPSISTEESQQDAGCDE